MASSLEASHIVLYHKRQGPRRSRGCLSVADAVRLDRFMANLGRQAGRQLRKRGKAVDCVELSFEHVPGARIFQTQLNHVGECPTCRGLVERIEALWKGVRALLRRYKLPFDLGGLEPPKIAQRRA